MPNHRLLACSQRVADGGVTFNAGDGAPESGAICIFALIKRCDDLRPLGFRFSIGSDGKTFLRCTAITPAMVIKREFFI